MGKTAFWLFLIGALLVLFISCESPPGEFTGKVTYSSGKPRAVNIRIVDKKGNVVWEGASDVDGTWYTGNVIPAGTYTIYYFDRDMNPFKGAEQQVTMTPGGIQFIEQTI